VSPVPLVDAIGRSFDLAETIVGARWIGDVAVFAAGDGVVAGHTLGEEVWTREGVHDGALLATCAGPGDDVLTAGDEGRVASIGADGAVKTLAAFKGAWIEAIAASRSAKLIAASLGKEVAILSPDGAEKHRFAHDATVTGIAFEPNGRRIAAAHYGGATISWAASPESRRKTLAWKGAHLSAIWTADAKFLVTTMQEQALHGWRLQDGQHFRMAGYPAKIRSVSFSSDNKWLATAGAQEVVLWPFQGPNGPINQSAKVAGELGTPCAAVACHPNRAVLVAGGLDGEVALMPLGGGKPLLVQAPDGAQITALAWSTDGKRLAVGSESGRASVCDFSEALG
jgi:WD40 repeat protein